ncbi:hypothetical protein KFL_006700080 [Klebsormidium nitens]|uniref:MYND-type domain-containing protein n=1 Tax=Klebsormidium nitens TaxID=105231 RepID=A0A1Y1IIF6_KLENI|nr:hypothetical protein KFL_006700080 [Klebsormidium nitens]|eukprot:GAQ90670.1 hypothetical protein KFL_006700080 [Klebsormidium nitens]
MASLRPKRSIVASMTSRKRKNFLACTSLYARRDLKSSVARKNVFLAVDTGINAASLSASVMRFRTEKLTYGFPEGVVSASYSQSSSHASGSTHRPRSMEGLALDVSSHLRSYAAIINGQALPAASLKLLEVHAREATEEALMSECLSSSSSSTSASTDSMGEQGRRALCVAIKAVKKHAPSDMSLQSKHRVCEMVKKASEELNHNAMKRQLTDGDIKSLTSLLASNHHLLLHDIPTWFLELNDDGTCGPKRLEWWQGEYITDIAFMVLKLLRSLKYLSTLEDTLKVMGAPDASTSLVHYMRLLDRPRIRSTGEESRNFRKGARNMLNLLNTGSVFFDTSNYDRPITRVHIDVAVDVKLMCAFCFATRPEGRAGPEWQRLHVCSRCKGRAYCSKKCSVSDWKEHKLSCNSREKGQVSLRAWETFNEPEEEKEWCKSVDDILLDMSRDV